MDAVVAAQRWAATWAEAWPRGDVGAVAALYAPEHVYRALAFGQPTNALPYLLETFAAESQVECWFGEPVAAGDRAAVEWWGTWLEHAKRATLAGVTVLRFDDDGLVVEHRDYWNELERREEPYSGWRS